MGRTHEPAPPLHSSDVLQIGHYDGNEPSDFETSFHMAAMNLHPGSSHADPDSALTATQAVQAPPVDAIYPGRRYPQRHDREFQRDQHSYICYHCYQTGHSVPSCPESRIPPHNPHFQPRLYDNYMKLTITQRDHLQSVGPAPIILDLPAIQQSPVNTGATSSVTPVTSSAPTTSTAAPVTSYSSTPQGSKN